MRLEGTVFAFVDQCLGGMEGCEGSSPARVLVEIRFQHALAPGQHIPGVLDKCSLSGLTGVGRRA